MTTACALAMCCPLAVAESGTSADELMQDASHVLRQFDSGHYAEVWQEAAPFVQAKIPEDQFVNAMRQACETVGTVSSRGWASVTWIRYMQDSNVPDGLCANVDLATTLTGGRIQLEKLSFRLGSDGRRRFTHSVPRLSQDVATTTRTIKP